MTAMELVFFSSNLDPRLGQDVFYGGAIELGEILVELIIREESLLEGFDSPSCKMEWRLFLS